MNDNDKQTNFGNRWNKLEEEFDKNSLNTHSQVFELFYYDDFYYDDIDSKFLRANIEFFGDSYYVQIYNKNGNLSEGIKSVSEIPIELEILRFKDDMLIVEIGSDIFKIGVNDYMKIKTFLHNLSPQNNIFKEEIYYKAKGLLNIDYKTSNIIINFIHRMPIELFLSNKMIAEVDAVLKSYYKFSDVLLMSDEISRARYSSVIFIHTQIDAIEHRLVRDIVSDNINSIKSYVDNEFKFLNEYIMDEYKIEKSDSAHLLYTLITIKAIDIFSYEWEKEYGELFNEIEKTNLIDAIKKYYQIDAIDANSLLTKGKFVCYLMKQNKFNIDNKNYYTSYLEFETEKKNATKIIKKETFFNKIFSKKTDYKNSVTIDDIDMMTGIEFEEFVAKLFTKKGYTVSMTKHSGDQGIDVIVEKNNSKMGIQTKCYSNTVGNSAIQEVVAGKNYYKLDKAIVITNNFFTLSAIKLAEANEVILWDRNILKEKLD